MLWKRKYHEVFPDWQTNSGKLDGNIKETADEEGVIAGEKYPNVSIFMTRLASSQLAAGGSLGASKMELDVDKLVAKGRKYEDSVNHDNQ